MVGFANLLSMQWPVRNFIAWYKKIEMHSIVHFSAGTLIDKFVCH